MEQIKGNNNKGFKIFYFTTLFVGLILMVFEEGIYRKTIISAKEVLVLIFFFSIIFFFVINKNYKITYQIKNSFYPFVQAIVSFGFIACYIFMALNFYLADSKIGIKSFPILSKHNIGSKYPQPAIIINYEGIEKQLVFYIQQQKQVDSSNNVLLTVKKGFFGYDIFSNIILK